MSQGPVRVWAATLAAVLLLGARPARAQGLAAVAAIAPEAPKVRLHLATAGSILYRQRAGTSEVSQVCVAPCDVEAPLGDIYRLSLHGTTSRPFRVRDQPGHLVELAADPPVIGGAVLGGALAIAGGFAFTVATFVAVVLCPATSNVGPTPCVDALLISGAGAGALVLGVVAALNSLSTDVTQRIAPTRPPRAFVPREPMWRVAGVAEGATAPRAAMVTLWSGHF